MQVPPVLISKLYFTTTCSFVVLISVSLMKFPVPEAALLLMPVTRGLSQLNVVPMLASAVYSNATPLQTFSATGLVRSGVGTTEIMKDKTGPLHPDFVAYTLTVSLTVRVSELTTIKPGIFPTPLTPKPMLALLVQWNSSPEGLLLNVIPLITSPLQYVLSETLFINGDGSTLMAKSDCGFALLQPLAVTTTLIVAVLVMLPELAAIKAAIFPLPAIPKPMSCVLVH